MTIPASLAWFSASTSQETVRHSSRERGARTASSAKRIPNREGVRHGRRLLRFAIDNRTGVLAFCLRRAYSIAFVFRFALYERKTKHEYQRSTMPAGEAFSTRTPRKSVNTKKPTMIYDLTPSVSSAASIAHSSPRRRALSTGRLNQRVGAPEAAPATPRVWSFWPMRSPPVAGGWAVPGSRRPAVACCYRYSCDQPGWHRRTHSA